MEGLQDVRGAPDAPTLAWEIQSDKSYHASPGMNIRCKANSGTSCLACSDAINCSGAQMEPSPVPAWQYTFSPFSVYG